MKAPVVAAIDLGGTKLASALVTARGRVSQESSEPTCLTSRRACYEQVLDAALQLKPKGAAAVGVSIPGLVRRDGTVWAPNLPGWSRMPLGKRLSTALGVRVVVESDRNASVVGEAWRGAARGADDAIYLIVGTGIGAGILSGGRLVRGAHELSGCAGWMPVADGEGFAALERVAAGPAVGAEGAVAMRRPDATARDVLVAARQGDRAAREVVQHAALRLGLAVSSLISLFDPEVIVLGGGLGNSGETLLRPLRRTAVRYAQPLSAKLVRITHSRLGGRAQLLGAAKCAFNYLQQGTK